MRVKRRLKIFIKNIGKNNVIKKNLKVTNKYKFQSSNEIVNI